ncbi:VOC family protein [Amycolatopsis sp. cg5]|uniref:VOC family protein n=1 Tax=Amycolatopsis sp. cg5 TaxID=3238802 RepID=UPI003524FAD2
MSLSSPSVPRVLPSGIPCWIELTTTDEARAQHFYSNLFGWQYATNRDPATPTRRYSIASLNGVAVGGLYTGARNQPPGWTVHLSVQHTASAAEWVTELGGKVTLGPIAIPHRGSILHAIDASGAPVVFWEPDESWEFGTGVANTFSGADLNVHDGEAADHFYCRLFNYQSHQIGDAETVDYAEWCIEHEPVLYRYVMGREYLPTTPPHWMVYIKVDPAKGTDAVAGQALLHGGTVVIEPYDTPFGRVAILADPDGAVFAIIDHEYIADNVGRAEVDDPYDD